MPTLLPVTAIYGYQSYPGDNPYFVIDKTGTIYQVTQGDNNKTAPWAVRVWRCPPKAKPEQIFSITDGHGALVVINKKLYFGYTTGRPDWKQAYEEVPGYIDWDNTPSGTVVNVNEQAMAVYKQQVALAQNTAQTAQVTANKALSASTAAAASSTKLQQQIDALNLQVATLQKQMLTQSQVEDIVWTKTWDILYLIRMGYLKGTSSIQNVQDWLNDLRFYITNFIR